MRIFLLVTLLAWGLTGWADTATIVDGARVNLRSGKYDTYRVVRALEPGTEVEVLNQERSYVQVKTKEGETGWLPLRLVTIAVTPAPQPVAMPEVLKPEIVPAPTEIKQNVNASYASSIWLLIGVGGASLVSGILLGMGGMLAYYRKKLNGLRI